MICFTFLLVNTSCIWEKSSTIGHCQSIIVMKLLWCCFFIVMADLPKDLAKGTTPCYGPNSFILHRLVCSSIFHTFWNLFGTPFLSLWNFLTLQASSSKARRGPRTGWNTQYRQINCSQRFGWTTQTKSCLMDR